MPHRSFLESGSRQAPLRVARAFARLGLRATLLAWAATANAQIPSAPGTSCNGLRVSSIVVNAKRPDFGGRSAYWHTLAHGVGLHHTTTDPAVVEHLLALEVGRPCTDFRLRESERLLRSQPFLADAHVRAIPDDEGGVRIEIETVDEIPVIVGAGISGTQVTSAELGNANLFGQGMMLSAHYAKRIPDGTVIGERFLDHTFMDRPYSLQVDAEHLATGMAWTVGAGHAYLTDLQRIAWEGGVAGENRYNTVHRTGKLPDVGILFRRRQADIGAVGRLGSRAHRLLVGVVGTYADIDPHGWVSITNAGVVPDTELSQLYVKQRVIRGGLVAGIRKLDYLTVHGLDALTATQDLAYGLQFVTLASHSIGGDHSDFLGADLYVGNGSPRAFTQAHVRSEGRADNWTGHWSGLVTHARASFYVKRTPENTVHFWTDASLGLRVNRPFQLNLRTDDAYLPGYGGADADAARRLVGGVEGRRFIGRFRGRADVGMSAFLSAGRLWAGDAPYGVSTRTLPSIGVGLLAAVPPGSKRLWRLDFTLPLRQYPGNSRFEVRLSSSDATTAIWREPRDVMGGRERIVGPDIFAARP